MKSPKMTRASAHLESVMIMMNNWKQRTVLLLGSLLCATHGVWADSGAWFTDRQRGYYFYEEPVEEVPEPEAPEPEPTPAPALATPVTQAPPTAPQAAPGGAEGTYLGQLKAMGKQWEEEMSLAILDPSIENVRNWMKTHTRVIDQAGNFAKGFQETIWVSPEYDTSVDIPTGAQTIKDRNQQQIDERNQGLSEMAASKGLLYVFRSDCPHCTRFSPILVYFANMFGFSVLPVSLDGRGTPEFPNPRKPNAFIDQLNVSVVPSVYVVDPTTKNIVPAHFGFSDFSQLSVKVLHAGKQFDQLHKTLVTQTRP